MRVPRWKMGYLLVAVAVCGPVHYAAKDHFDAHGTHNLTMRLRVLQTDKGERYYTVSGN